MSHQLNNLSAFQIPELENYNFNFGESRSNTLEGIKSINIIIGANNSGKSRLLRECFFYSIKNNLDYTPSLYTKIKEILVLNPTNWRTHSLEEKISSHLTNFF